MSPVGAAKGSEVDNSAILAQLGSYSKIATNVAEQEVEQHSKSPAAAALAEADAARRSMEQHMSGSASAASDEHSGSSEAVGSLLGDKPTNSDSVSGADSAPSGDDVPSSAPEHEADQEVEQDASPCVGHHNPKRRSDRKMPAASPTRAELPKL